MAIRDTTQIGQPVSSAPVLPTLPATSPDKLIKAFPQFADYYADTEKRYKRILEAIRASFDDLALPVALTTAEVKKNYAEFKDNNAGFDETITTIADELSASVTRITTLEAHTVTSDARITLIETTYVTLTTATSLISTAQSAAVTSAETYTDGQISSLSAIYATTTDVTTIVATAQAAAVTSANAYTAGQISSLSTVYATIGSVSSSISTAISAAVTTANTYTDGQITSLSTVYATPSYVTSSISTAVSAGVTSANGYTNAQIATLTTAYTTADTALASAISALAASSGIHTFTGASTPTATGVGDIWYQTGSGIVHEFRWDGSSWVSVKDSDIAANAAAIITEQTSRVGADGFLSSKYTLSVIAGNIVTGMNITSSTGTGTNISDVTFQASSFNIYNSTTATAVPVFQVSGGQVRITSNLVIGAGDVGAVATGGAAADVNAGVTTIAGGKITAATINASQVGTNLLITSAANIQNATITNAHIASVDATAIVAGTISVALELTAAKFTAGIIATGASRFNTADASRLMPFISYGIADLVTEHGGPITPGDTSTSGTAFTSTFVTFAGWTSGSTGVDTRRFGLSTTAFLATLQGNGNVPTGRMGFDICYRINGGSWIVFTGHNVIDNTSFGNISMSTIIPISGLGGGDTVEFGAMLDHSSGAAGPGIGGLFISVGVFNG